MNNLPNVWTTSPELTVKGPVLRSYRYNQTFRTYMHYFECSVGNKAVLPATQFGAFSEIVNRGNSNQAWLQIWVAPGFFDTPSAPTFTAITTTQRDINEYICEATITEQIVAIGTAVDTGSTVWESSVESIDGVHALKRTVTIGTLNTVQFGEFDQVLASHIAGQRELVHDTIAESDFYFPSGLRPMGGTRYDYIQYEKVKCDWYIKTTRKLDSTYGYTSTEVRNGYWPPVLLTPPEIAGVDGYDEVGQTYTVKQARELNIQDAYNGPCSATIVIAWSPTAPTGPSPGVTQFVTDEIYYEGILFDIRIPGCLHPSLTLFENVNNHPVYPDQVRSKTYPGTTHETWPATQVADYSARPYLGGWVIETVTLAQPV